MGEVGKPVRFRSRCVNPPYIYYEVVQGIQGFPTCTYVFFIVSFENVSRYMANTNLRQKQKTRLNWTKKQKTKIVMKVCRLALSINAVS